MAVLEIRAKFDGITLEKLNDSISFKDKTPPVTLPPGDNAYYCVHLVEQGTNSNLYYWWLKDHKRYFTLAHSPARYNQIYDLTISLYHVTGSGPGVNAAPGSLAAVETSSPIVIYTPAFPHAAVQENQRSLLPNKPYKMDVIEEDIVFEKIPGWEAYWMRVWDMQGNKVHDQEHSKKNHEYYIRPAAIRKMAFSQKYAVQAKAKIRDYRDDFGPLYYIRTPGFPKPEFKVQNPMSINLNMADIKLDKKIKGTSRLEYQLVDNELNAVPTPPAGSFATLKIKAFSIEISLSAFTNAPFPIQGGTAYWIRCRGLRHYNNGTWQDGPYSDWLSIKTV